MTGARLDKGAPQRNATALARRQGRIYALQALYQADIATAPAAPALSGLFDALLEGEGLDGSRAPEADEAAFAQRIVDGVEANRPAIDALIDQCSTNWRIHRMPAVDRNILRLAAFELGHCTDIPATATINEAIELAKAFGTEDSRAFVNGIVDRMGRVLGRLSGERRKGSR